MSGSSIVRAQELVEAEAEVEVEVGQVDAVVHLRLVHRRQRQLLQ